MHFLITGGTGLIGRALIAKVIGGGHEVTVLTRNPDRSVNKFSEDISFISSLSEVSEDKSPNIIINLAGEPISKRWTKGRKYELINSRLGVTKEVVDYITLAENKPELLISGSAIGYYGNHETEEFTEESGFYEGFTHEVCQRWEAEALSAKDETRVCLLRTGIVLTKDGGALAQMLPAFKLGLGGVMGDGSQWMSWIHIDDLVSIIEYLVQNKEISGPVNATAPNPATNRDFTKTLGKALKRPTIFPIPAFVLKVIFGKMAQALLLSGQKVLPKKLLDSGFQFKYADLESALKEIFK